MCATLPAVLSSVKSLQDHTGPFNQLHAAKAKRLQGSRSPRVLLCNSRV